LLIHLITRYEKKNKNAKTKYAQINKKKVIPTFINENKHIVIDFSLKNSNNKKKK
jgi:hypothetical protein